MCGTEKSAGGEKEVRVLQVQAHGRATRFLWHWRFWCITGPFEDILFFTFLLFLQIIIFFNLGTEVPKYHLLGKGSIRKKKSIPVGVSPKRWYFGTTSTWKKTIIFNGSPQLLQSITSSVVLLSLRLLRSCCDAYVICSVLLLSLRRSCRRWKV